MTSGSAQKILCAVTISACALLVMSTASAADHKAASVSASPRTSVNPDEMLAAKVRKKIAWMYPSLARAGNIHVRVIDGVVVLTGVGSSVQVDQAEDAASRVSGVQAVNEKVHVNE